MWYAKDKWEKERTSWRTIVQLNLVHSVNTILEALRDAIDDDDEQDPLPFTDRHYLLLLRLRPLWVVESDLKRLLGAKAEGILERQISRIDDAHCKPNKRDGVSNQDVTEVIESCKQDILALWADHVIREMLQRHGIRLEDTASLSVCSPPVLIHRFSLMHGFQFFGQHTASHRS